MKKLSTPLILIVLLSLLLGACTTPAPTVVVTDPPAVVDTETPVPVPPTAEPPVVVAPDFQAIFTSLFADVMNADKGYGAVSAAKLNEELVDKAPFLLDVREASELEANGFIKGAINIPVRDVFKNLDKLPAPDQPIVIYCASGHRGAFAFAALRALGYTDVRNLAGGLGAWSKAGFAVETGAPAAPVAGTAPEVDPALLAAFDTYFSALPEGFFSIKSDKLNEELADKAPFLLDVRRAQEFAENGRIAGAYNVPVEELLTNLDLLPSMDTPIVIYCVSGHRGAVATMALQLMGYTDVRNLAGGLNAWKAAQFPVEGLVDWNAQFTTFFSGMPDNFYATSAANLNTALVENPPFLVDVREPSEVADGYIAGAINIPVRDLFKNLDKLPALDQPIVIYCASGHRGGLAAAALRLLGYTDVVNLGGGLGAWKKAELPVETAAIAAPVAGEEPVVDATMLTKLDEFFSSMPEGFYTVKAVDLNAELGMDPKPFVLDVREATELTTDGYIEGSVNIPVRELMANLGQLPADKATKIVVLCKSGHRGSFALLALRLLGYTDVRNLGGGINAWIGAELPVVK